MHKLTLFILFCQFLNVLAIEANFKSIDFGVGLIYSLQLHSHKTIDCTKQSSGESLSGYQTDNENNGGHNLGINTFIGKSMRFNNFDLGFEVNVGANLLSNSNRKTRTIAVGGITVTDETDDILLVKSKEWFYVNYLFLLQPNNYYVLIFGGGVAIWSDSIIIHNYNNTGARNYLTGSNNYNMPLRTQYQDISIIDTQPLGTKIIKESAIFTKEAKEKNKKLLPSISAGLEFNTCKKRSYKIRILYTHYLLSNKVKVIAYDEKDINKLTLLVHDQFKHSKLGIELRYKF